jgi:predicted anti-sigma-YlaC factor YlaD
MILHAAHPSEERLGDFIDGLLDEEERRGVAFHLETCSECRDAVTSTRELLDHAAGLSPEIEPSRDLWPEIARRIRKKQAGPVRFRIVPGIRIGRPLAAAAGIALLVAASSLATALILQQNEPETDEAMTGLAGGRVALAAFESAETDYAEATRQLLEAYQARRDRLSPETVKIVEENLRIIDDALQKTRAALEADPSNSGLSDLTAATYQKKIDFLRRTLSLSS